MSKLKNRDVVINLNQQQEWSGNHLVGALEGEPEYTRAQGPHNRYVARFEPRDTVERVGLLGSKKTCEVAVNENHYIKFPANTLSPRTVHMFLPSMITEMPDVVQESQLGPFLSKFHYRHQTIIDGLTQFVENNEERLQGLQNVTTMLDEEKMKRWSRIMQIIEQHVGSGSSSSSGSSDDSD